jgi:hypothetical protein
VELLGIFKKTEQKSGGISFYDFIQILRSTQSHYFRLFSNRIEEERRDIEGNCK